MVNPTTNRTYVATYGASTLTVIDGFTNAIVTTGPVGTGPSGVATNTTTRRIYVTNYNANTVSVLEDSPTP